MKSEHVKTWRRKTKNRIIEAMGRQCQCCGYKTSAAALELHHIDPNSKDIGFGRIRSNPKSWKLIVCELRKCILVCANCHREVHDGSRKLPLVYSIFDETFADYKFKKSMEPCPICGKAKPIELITCSLACAARKRQKVDWGTIDLLQLLTRESKLRIAARLGVSEAAVRKRVKKLVGG